MMESGRSVRGGWAVGIGLWLAFGNMATAADWPQWRGPDRNGIAPESPALSETWPPEGPPKVWQSEAIPSAEQGNLSSPVVAGGKVYLHVNWRYKDPIATRTLPDGGLRNLGWRPEKMPEELLKQVEEARASEERAKLPGNEVGKWVEAWAAAHLLTDEQKKLADVVKNRLNRGKDALGLGILDKLATIKDKPFATQEDLDKWLAENGIEEELKKKVVGQIPTTRDLADDTLVCLDAADGKTLWKVKFPSAATGWDASSTPCVAGKRLYVHGSQKNVYCLDVEKGNVVWTNRASQGNNISSSFLVQDGLAVILAGPLTAFDAQTGEVKWTQPKISGNNPSPVLWKNGDRMCVICNTGGNLGCADLKTGDVLWTVPGGSSSTTAVSNDLLVVFSDRKEVGMTGYRLLPDKAETAWTLALNDRGASPIIANGRVYAIGGGGGGRAVCVDVATGQAAWDEKVGSQEISSPILADGKIVALVDNYSSLAMWKASPEKFAILAKAKVGAAACTSPAFAGGKLFLRVSNGVACYDLTVKPPAPAAP